MSSVTVKQERNNKGIAFIVTVVVHLAILLFLFYYVIITPLPPYKLIPVPEIEVEADFGNGINGTGHVEQSNVGENPNPEKMVKSVSKVSATTPSAPVLTNDAEEPSNIKSPKKNTNTTKIDTSSAPQQVTPELAGVFNKFRHSKGGTPGGDGNSGHAGNAGEPNGTNPGESMGNSPIGYKLDMNGRKILSRANVSADCHEEGTVVVKVIVDQSGKVISANPGEQGSNTTNPCLYEKAKEAALATKISASPDGTPEQQGKITVKFTVH